MAARAMIAPTRTDLVIGILGGKCVKVIDAGDVLIWGLKR